MWVYLVVTLPTVASYLNEKNPALRGYTQRDLNIPLHSGKILMGLGVMHHLR